LKLAHHHFQASDGEAKLHDGLILIQVLLFSENSFSPPEFKKNRFAHNITKTAFSCSPKITIILEVL